MGKKNNIKWELMRYIRTSFVGRCSWYHYMRFQSQKKNIPEIFNKFGEKLDLHPEFIDMMKDAMVKYHWNFEEFFIFDYPKLSEKERMSFVSEYDKNIFCDKVNDKNQDIIFHDKWDTYQSFKKYFKRDVVLIKDEKDLKKSEFKSFIEKHNKFIIKPVDAATGRGIEILTSKELDKFKFILNSSKSNYIVEELIIQSPEMSKLHPSSVNTIRIPTFRCNGKVEILHPFLRVGKGNSFVDNAGHGGIMGIIDTETGVVTVAGDESKNFYVKHPDTNLNIVGFKIPFWNEAISFVKELSSVLPNVRYVGWDIALTNKGWVLIEGNEKGQFLWQMVLQKGFKEEFLNICKKNKC